MVDQSISEAPRRRQGGALRIADAEGPSMPVMLFGTYWIDMVLFRA
jgi:hypothetical protein